MLNTISLNSESKWRMTLKVKVNESEQLPFLYEFSFVTNCSIKLITKDYNNFETGPKDSNHMYYIFAVNEDGLISYCTDIIVVYHTGGSINSLAPSDAIWWHRTVSTLVQVMACCLTAPSHYLNQCWLIMSRVLWHSLSCEMLKISILDMSLKITYLKLQLYLPGANELNMLGSNYCLIKRKVMVAHGEKQENTMYDD